ncbi:MAG TPA: glycoside hydrolase family 97 N-terminal domain-containing protein, partial [Caulobacter sp.]|nr:glycoside hydrolase family 97 N-terminal domain-containing protein [Caulobacter sp.]
MALAMSQIIVASPDKSAEIRIAADGASYSVQRKGEPIVATSPMGLELAGAPDFANLEVVEVKRHSQRRDIPLTATKARTARDWYNGAVVIFREKTGARRTLSVEARASDDGVAFRYLLPKEVAVTLKGEKTAYRLPKDPACEVTEYTGSHENPWILKKISELDRAKLYDVPVACSSASGRTHYAIAQSGIEAYAGSSLAPVNGGLKVKVTPLPGAKDVAVKSAAGLTSAWRVIMMGDRAGDLIESPLIGNLAPQAKGDYSWVKPGKAAWDWWSGPLAGEKPTMERFHRFIDFAADSGFPYFLIDAGWPLNATPCCDA